MPNDVIGIDPGPAETGWARLSIYRATGERSVHGSLIPSGAPGVMATDVVGIEQVEARGMAVGQETFTTAMWSGWYAREAVGRHVPTIYLIPRRVVKSYLCGSTRAKDTNIRQRLIDLFGGKERAIGKKKAPGPLYGIKSHLWAAVAVAVVAHDLSVVGNTGLIVGPRAEVEAIRPKVTDVRLVMDGAVARSFKEGGTK